MSMLWYPELAAELARQDITHTGLAAAVGCSPTAISHIVRGRLRPSDELRQRIADHLGGDIDQLFAENELVHRLANSRTAQGLSETITDQAVLRRIVTLAGDRNAAA